MSTDKQREENLNESWVDVGTSGGSAAANSSPVPLRTTKDVMERLLLEAQRESTNASHANTPASSKASSNGDRTANSGSPQAEVESLPELKENDWIWDWSSRPEICPPTDTATRLKHPETTPQRCRLSLRNTWIMRSLWFSVENLPVMIVTHAVSFILGATTMFVVFRRYGNWTSSAIISTV